MPETLPEPIAQALQATAEFLAGENDLVTNDTNERSLTHKLAEYLQRRFPEWNVDCEYNRLGDAKKVLPRTETVETDSTDGQTIFPDIIVHKRLKKENLLVIEVKKSTNKKAGDEEKLTGLTLGAGSFGYDFGLHLILDCGRCGVAGLKVYRNGEVDKELTDAVTATL